MVEVIKQSCASSKLGDAWLTLLESHGDVDQILGMEEEIDLLIPRGTNQFVKYVMEHTSIPVLGHADGICHLYIDEKADLDKAVEIAFDSKTQYPAACNAVETILCIRRWQNKCSSLWPGDWLKCCHPWDSVVCSCIQAIPYEQGDWEREYLQNEVNIHVVDSLQQAIEHIEEYGSHHTDAIVSEDSQAVRTFFTQVDSADVFANCSTRFSDGYRFGLGAGRYQHGEDSCPRSGRRKV